MPVQLNGKDLLASFSDVEEGVFTPGIGDGGFDGSGESQVYNVQVGRYMKIGNRVLFFICVRCTDLGCLTTCEDVVVTGLPFTSISTSNTEAPVMLGNSNSLALSAADQSVTGGVKVNGTYIRLMVWDGTIGITDMLVSEYSVGGQVFISGVYEI